MARIRKVEIMNFRSIGRLDWFPLAGINCLIGPGDSGKSTILDAIDFCLGARRNLTFCDDDFHRLQLQQPIQISVTLGNSTAICVRWRPMACICGALISRRSEEHTSELQSLMRISYAVF